MPSNPHIIDNGTPGRYWHMLDNGKIQCDICPRECQLGDGQRGLCFVRARKSDEIILTTYGRSSGFSIDPIEKKPLNHFLPGTAILSFGTAGCNLTCKFCQNHDMSKSREMDKLQSRASPQDIAITAVNHGCRSVAYTYNDPVIFLEYAVDVARACKERNIKNVAVTAGYIKEAAREEFFENMDAVNLDLKAFSKDFYKKLCTAEFGNILETAKFLAQKQDTWLEITTLLIPNENDSDGEIQQLCNWIAKELGPNIPLHFTAFHPDFKMLDTPRTPASTLINAYDTAVKSGLNYIYTGNILHEKTASTYCPSCKEKLISREWHQLQSWHIGVSQQGGGHCLKCEHPIVGIFEEKPGQWGRKRKRVIPDQYFDNAAQQPPPSTKSPSPKVIKLKLR